MDDKVINDLARCVKINDQIRRLKKMAADLEHGETELGSVLLEAARSMESLFAQLQNGWTYCKDGKNLPKDGQYFCTVSVIGENHAFTAEMTYENGTWFWYEKEGWDDEEDYSMRTDVHEVIAWREVPLPCVSI